MARKRKAKKRSASSSRKRRRRRSTRPRPTTQPKPIPLSSDEDFKVSQEEDDDDEEEEEEAAAEDDDDDGDEDEDCVDAEDEVVSSSRRQRVARSSVLRSPSGPLTRHRIATLDRDSSLLDFQNDTDDEFDVNLQRALENDFLERERGRKNEFSRIRNVTFCAAHTKPLEMPEKNEREGEGDNDGGNEKKKRKGKEKVLAGDGSSTYDAIQNSGVREEDENARVCGVCLIEESNVERGKLDCCDHFFCFGCIMEWAKVESRCPMCKQRFITILKPAGLGKRKRTVRVPTRNQVYIPPDEQDLPIEDPLAEVVCMECHGTGDEDLLLLCDRCEAAAHTYCVGLGRSVPLGDWFCRACQAFVGENSDDENEEEELVLASDSENENEGESDENGLEEKEDYILRSIVASTESSQDRRQRQRREARVSSGSRLRSRSSNVIRRRKRVRSESRRRIQNRLLGRCRDRDPAVLLSRAVRAISSSHASVSRSQIGSARTVPQQRRLQERIHFLRSNWRQTETDNSGVSGVTLQVTNPPPMVIPGINPINIETNEISSDANHGESSLQRKRELEEGSQTKYHAQNLMVERNSTASSDPSKCAVPSSSYRRISSEILEPPPSNLSIGFESEIAVESAKMDRDNVITGNSVDCTSKDIPHRERSNGKHKLESHKLYESNGTSDIGKPYANIVTSANAEKHVCMSQPRKNVVNGGASSSQDGLKVHLTEIVKKQIWPWYLTEGLGKEQFKQIARAAVHTLLALVHSGSEGLSCQHPDDDRGKSPVSNCCGRCFNSHVEKAVNSAKQKVIPS